MKNTIVLAKTFTCKYDSKEDRLMLTLNYHDITERMDFWITRSFLLKLLPVFFDFSTQATPMTDSSGHKDTTSQTDTSTYLLTQKRPILLESVDFQRQSNNLIKLVFKNFKEALFAEALLDQPSMDSFIKLLLNSAPKYEWGVYTV